MWVHIHIHMCVYIYDSGPRASGPPPPFVVWSQGLPGPPPVEGKYLPNCSLSMVRTNQCISHYVCWGSVLASMVSYGLETISRCGGHFARSFQMVQIQWNGRPVPPAAHRQQTDRRLDWNCLQLGAPEFCKLAGTTACSDCALFSTCCALMRTHTTDRHGRHYSRHLASTSKFAR